ncbi:MAG: hypothetical protein ACFFD5_06045 [Candidatus Thorarchaeota archaeon]
MEEKKRKYKNLILAITITLLIVFCFVYYLYWSTISNALIIIEGAELATLSAATRIVILSIMSYILFRKWFKQEVIYTSDAYFLFALFFMILTVGKLYDLLYNLILISDTFGDLFILMLSKIRYYIIIINILPILYIGLEATMTFVSVYVKDLSKKQFSKIRLWIIFIVLLGLTIVITLATNITFLINVLPFFTIAIFIMIAIMFLFMYKNKRLSQANGLIIGIAFLYFIITNLLRSLISVIALTHPSFIVVADLLDISANVLMFIGFISKPSYAK